MILAIRPMEDQSMDDAFFKCGFCGAEAPKGQHVCGDRVSEEEARRCNDEWMNSLCPVCGRRLGAHKAIPGFMGKGCPGSGESEHG